MREIRWIPVLMAGLWGGVLVTLLAGCGVKSEAITDSDMRRLEVELVRALDNYCGATDYRDEVCAVEFEQGFGDPR